MTTRKNNN